MAKLYQGRLYRGLPCFSGDRASVATVSCFLIEPEWRRQGVASELLGAAIEGARTAGFAALEALPRGATDVSDEEQWMGPASLYEQAGFAKVHDFSPYPVYRLAFESGAS
jgi:GNAT superfamily N-acetyltransferase